MSNKSDGSQNAQSAKVLKLGLNISVSGDPGTDFEIVLDDKDQKKIESSLSKEEPSFDAIGFESSRTDTPKHELEKKTQEVTQSKSKSTGAIPKYRRNLNWETSKMSDSENAEDPNSQEPSIIKKLRNTMEHFEKFSDHIKDIPRLRNRPLATSTPFSDKYNSRSESSLVYLENRPRLYSHMYDCYSRKEYFKGSFRPSPPDLFLKPLPGENCHMRGVYTRYFDLEPYRHYGSDNSLNKTFESKSFYGKSSYDVDKYETLLPDPPVGILKKSDSESGDRQSTSSADSVKDIKIYQSGGILIMQNFKDNMDPSGKKEMSEFSAKLIENCNKLKMEVSGIPNDKPAIGNISDETKNSGKMVQFDLSSFEGTKSKSGDSPLNATKDESSLRMESSESTSDCMKNKDTSPQGTFQSQDLTSLSTQENDSIMSNQPGLSPTYASSKKLEWDSGADIGYLNLDLTKENLSTIEKIVLKGLSSDGLSEENIVYEKKSKSGHKVRSQLTLERSDKEESMKSSDERVTVDIEKGKEKEVELKNSSEGGSLAKENFKDELKSEESKPSSRKRTPTPKSKESQPREKPKELTDKSVNVNTLFKDPTWQTPTEQNVPKEIITPSESPTKVSNRRTSHSPKGKLSKPKTRSSSTRRPPKKSPSITGPLLASYFDMGNPKKVYRRLEGSPALNDVELSRGVEEIIIDQRFKFKQTGREATKEPVMKTDNGKAKSRPISASSSSNNTVLPKSDGGEKGEAKASEREKFADQIIQTSDFDCESIGVQAFESQVQSDCDLKSFREKEAKKVSKETVNVSSKNIQAFGLNSSLPKQLEHPKEIESVDMQHTKSTQYFGGALNSLPNYHPNVVTKPQETCGRAPNVLKTKKNSEIIRMNEENEKNILANDSLEKNSKRSNSNNENKENLMSEKSVNSKKSQRNAIKKQSSTGANGSDSEKKESERKQKKKSSAENSDCPPTSDDVSSLVLTSEALKVHGDSIDRSIIQEKYFQSQLDEMEKRKMISRSTSMEIQVDPTDKEYITTGCQYSPQSRGTIIGGQEAEGESVKGPKSTLQRHESNPNQEQNVETGDSLPSSTQTAHSWMPGMRNSRENSSGVGKARSFEYLPGHIYESSGNLREELPSETEQNLITSSSSDSDRARGSVSNDGGRDSEGRETLILENSTENSSKSDRLKILDVNLALLNVAVTKLREKDAQVQNITKSLLARLCRQNGSGDWAPPGKMDDDRDGTEREVSERGPRGEFAIACQTEEKSPSSYYEERRVLEKRISEEKKCQIRWIENEIYHLNILRRLLEKQSSPVGKEQFRTPSDVSKSEENYHKNIVAEICPRPVTPVYGCTISLEDNNPRGARRPQSDRQQRDSDTCPTQCGVSVSVSGNTKKLRRVLMLPASVQVSLKDAGSEIGCEDDDKENMEGFHWKNSSADDIRRANQCDVHTQYPSGRNSVNYPSVSVQTEAQLLESSRCTKENCFCINLSDKSCSSSSRGSGGRMNLKMNSITEERDSEISKLTDSGNNKHLRGSAECQVKCRAAEDTTCKCQNQTIKPKSICRGSCQSNVYLSCDTADNRICPCSNVQVEKSSGCTCHIIKIHGARCRCSSEATLCSCKRNSGKKTENQSCQTQLPSSLEIKNLSEMQIRTETKKGVVQKQSCSPKVSYEILEPSIEELQVQEKFPMERSVQEIPVREKMPDCSCRKKAEKMDDHPRHYFLRIEEREMDNSVEDVQQKRSLEVVTVTVPVKKAGKSKIYEGNVPREESSTPPTNACNCCSICMERCQKPTTDPRSRRNEKLDIRTFNPYEDFREFPNEIGRKEYQPAARSSPQRESWYCDIPAEDDPGKQCCEGCRCANRNSPPSRDVDGIHDTHKKRKETENARVYEGRRKGEGRNRAEGEMDWGSESRGMNSGSDRYNSDYYNYNKREFMTKSELAKEERKRKVHQPSLQECLSSNRPDFYSSAERRRQIISERSKERVKKHNSRMDCLIKMMQQCNQNEQPSNTGPKRIFTSVQMREQTMKRYKKLPEVTGKIADERKKEEYRTNRLMADIFAKKLQFEALKGHINLSNSVSVLYTI